MKRLKLVHANVKTRYSGAVEITLLLQMLSFADVTLLALMWLLRRKHVAQRKIGRVFQVTGNGVDWSYAGQRLEGRLAAAVTEVWQTYAQANFPDLV